MCPAPTPQIACPARSAHRRITDADSAAQMQEVKVLPHVAVTDVQASAHWKSAARFRKDAS
jgi:hypothetical protein